MTHAAALVEARRRWGVNAGWKHYPTGWVVGVYAAGARATDALAEIKGSGSTREAALTDADDRAMGEAVDTIERLYDHLKAAAGDVDLSYALRTLNRCRAVRKK